MKTRGTVSVCVSLNLPGWNIPNSVFVVSLTAGIIAADDFLFQFVRLPFFFKDSFHKEREILLATFPLLSRVQSHAGSTCQGVKIQPQILRCFGKKKKGGNKSKDGYLLFFVFFENGHR